MANQPTPGYQSTWTGAIPNNQMMPTNPVPAQPTQTAQTSAPIPQPWNQWVPPQPQVVLIPVSSPEAVDTHPLAPNVTGFFLDYDHGMFWTKRQTPDGLGFTTIKHRFMTEEQYQNMIYKNQNGGNSGYDAKLDDVAAHFNDLEARFKDMCADIRDLRHEFDEFIK